MTKSHPPRSSSPIAWNDAPTKSIDAAGTTFGWLLIGNDTTEHTLRNTLIEKGVLREEGDFLIFTSDYSFTSASAAAATVIGASANGRILWKLPDGRTYADWETSQDVANGTSS